MERRIGKDIHRVSNRISRQMDRITEKYDFTHSQFGVMLYLIKNKEKDIFQKNIEEEFGVRRSSVSAILSHLEKKGYIVRSSVAHDGRLKKITATVKAEEVIEEVLGIMDEFEKRLLEKVTEEELEVFYGVLEKLYEMKNEELGVKS